jgi:hypothetical protein
MTCTHSDRRLFLDLGSSPLADSFPDAPNALASKFPLRLTVCPSCWLVELDTKVADERLFGADYAFFSGSSPALVRYFEDYARWVHTTFPDYLDAVVEIACNDGELLQHFRDTEAVGIDPAGPPTEAARAGGLEVYTEPFTAARARSLSRHLPSNRVVIANNVAAHVPNLDDFFEGLALVVGDHGVGIVEFQYLPELLLGNDFPLVYHEHRRFLSITSVMPVLLDNGLTVVDYLRTPTQGGSLRLVLKSSASATQTSRLAPLWAEEAWIRDLATYESLQGRVDEISRQLARLLDEEHEQGRTVALYGAPAKATTLLATLPRETLELIKYAVDLTPEKIGRYVPGTGIPIRHEREAEENEPVDTYLLAVGNYVSRVVRTKTDFLARGGRLIVPLPKPVIL